MHVCLIGQVSSVFTNSLGNQGSIPGRAHTKDFENGTSYLLA